MKRYSKASGIAFGLWLMILTSLAYGQKDAKPATETVTTMAAEQRAKSDEDFNKKAEEWVASLTLNDKVKETEVKNLIAAHLKAIRDWNNDHPASTVPTGINPATGNPLSALDRQVIAISAMPKATHETLMNGLRKNLTEPQVEAILDKYTIGKVAFTLNGYKSIVPDLTPAEEKVILENLKKAREQAIDYKNMTQISAIFEIYKTKNEQYLNTHGRNWHDMFKAYTDAVKAKKADAKAAAEGKPAQ
jgi:hypothetical protein